VTCPNQHRHKNGANVTEVPCHKNAHEYSPVRWSHAWAAWIGGLRRISPNDIGECDLNINAKSARYMDYIIAHYVAGKAGKPPPEPVDIVPSNLMFEPACLAKCRAYLSHRGDGAPPMASF